MTPDLHHVDPELGVPPSLFVDEMVKQWKEHGNVPSAKLKSAWGTFAAELNSHLHDHQTLNHRLMYRFALETGGGKSTGLHIYFAMLGAIAEVAENCPGALITAQRKDDCDYFQTQVNKLGKRYGMKMPMAVSYHSGTNKRTVKHSELKEWPFLATTQKGLLIGLIEQDVKGLFWNRLPSFLAYDSTFGWEESNSRHMILMDEALDPFATFSLSSDSLDELIDNIPGELAAQYEGIVMGLINLSHELRIVRRFSTGGEESIFGKWQETAPNVIPLINALRSYKEDKREYLQRWRDLQNLITVWYLQTGPVSYKKRGDLHHFSKSEFVLDRLNRGVFVLDATARTSKLLEAYGTIEDVKVGRVRNYKNLRIEADRTTRTGRATLVGREGENVDRFVDLIVDELLSLDAAQWEQVGVITFKDIVDAVKAKRLHYPFKVIFGNIGGVTGSNAFRDCDLLYIIGQNHRSPDYGSDIIATTERYVGNLKEEPEYSMDYDLIQSMAEDLPQLDSRTIQDHELARDLIQTIGRARNRRVVDNKGNCAPTTIRITMDENYALASFLERQIREHFYGVDYVDSGWRFVKGLKADPGQFDADSKEIEAHRQRAYQKASNNIDAAIWWFHYSGLSKKTIYSVSMQLGLKKEHSNKIRSALSKDNSRYKVLMKKLGVEVRKLPDPKGKDSWFLVQDEGGTPIDQ